MIWATPHDKTESSGLWTYGWLWYHHTIKRLFNWGGYHLCIIQSDYLDGTPTMNKPWFIY